ncbi:hypothetical protein [Agarivorans sp. DSG3-1]|uniref:hypothetical protein n=1 Tax=Agarivorans sp. DSG3-1 TaxID=3342249 RepID=UPI00398E33C6
MASKKEATYQSGAKKGKLKPGYKYAKGGGIVKAKAKAKTTEKKRSTKRKASRKKAFKLFK